MVLTAYPKEQKAREHLGVAVPEDMAGHALVLSVPKLNGAPPPPPLVIEKFPTPWALTLRAIDREALARAEAAANKLRVAEGVREAARLVQAACGRGQTVTRRTIEKREVAGIDAETFPMEFLQEVLSQAFERRVLVEVPGPRKGCKAVKANLPSLEDIIAANEPAAAAAQKSA